VHVCVRMRLCVYMPVRAYLSIRICMYVYAFFYMVEYRIDTHLYLCTRLSPACMYTIDWIGNALHIP